MSATCPEVRPAFLRGNQVQLKGLLARDLDTHPSAAYWTDDRRVTRYLSRGTYPARPEDYAHAKPGAVELGVWVGEDLIGVTGLHKISSVARSAEFRVLIGDPNYWRKGVGTEVSMLMCAYGFEVLNLNKVWLGVVRDNIGAVCAYKRTGFRLEGCLRAEVYRNRVYYDAFRMGMLRSEYDDRREKWPIGEVLGEQFPAP